MRKKIFCLFLVGAIFLLGCVGMPSQEASSIKKDVRIIKHYLRGLDPKSLVEVIELTKGLKKDLDEIKNTLTALKDIGIIKENQANLKYNQEELVSELTKTNEKFEELKYYIGEEIKKRYEQFKNSLDDINSMLKRASLDALKIDETGFQETKKALASLDVKISQLPEFYRINATEESRKDELQLKSISLKLDSLDAKLTEFFNLYKTLVIEKIKEKKKTSKSESPSE